jgi:hypothetical protein
LKKKVWQQAWLKKTQVARAEAISEFDLPIFPGTPIQLDNTAALKLRR